MVLNEPSKFEHWTSRSRLKASSEWVETGNDGKQDEVKMIGGQELVTFLCDFRMRAEIES